MVDYRENVYARRGIDGRSHIPALPFWVAIIRVFQLILTVLVLILAAYAFSVLGSYDVFLGGSTNAAYGFSFFVFAWTVLFLAYIFIAPLWVPAIYLYWAHLGLEILTVIFWLVDFALLANAASQWNSFSNDLNTISGDINGNYGAGNIYSRQDLSGLNTTAVPNYSIDYFIPHATAAIGSTKGAAALGAINWLLFVITLIAFGYFLHQHRIANGEGGFLGSGTRAAPPAGDVESARAYEKNNPVAPVELRNVDNQPVPPPPAA